MIFCSSPVGASFSCSRKPMFLVLRSPVASSSPPSKGDGKECDEQLGCLVRLIPCLNVGFLCAGFICQSLVSPSSCVSASGSHGREVWNLFWFAPTFPFVLSHHVPWGQAHARNCLWMAGLESSVTLGLAQENRTSINKL